jgi:hypothetical protein
MFWKVRLTTFIWGFLVVYAFTRRLDLTSLLFLTQVLGNTIIMWVFLKDERTH